MKITILIYLFSLSFLGIAQDEVEFSEKQRDLNQEILKDRTLLDQEIKNLKNKSINKDNIFEVKENLARVKGAVIALMIEEEKKKNLPRFTSLNELNTYVQDALKGKVQNKSSILIHDYENLKHYSRDLQNIENNIQIADFLNNNNCNNFNQTCSQAYMDVIVEGAKNCETNLMHYVYSEVNDLSGGECDLIKIEDDIVETINSQSGEKEDLAKAINYNNYKFSIKSLDNYYNKKYPGLKNLTANEQNTKCNRSQVISSSKDYDSTKFKECSKYLTGPFLDFSANYIAGYEAFKNNLSNQFSFEQIIHPRYGSEYSKSVEKFVDEMLVSNGQSSTYLRSLGVDYASQKEDFNFVRQDLINHIKHQYALGNESYSTTLNDTVKNFCSEILNSNYENVKCMKRTKSVGKTWRTEECYNRLKVDEAIRNNKKIYANAVMKTLGATGGALLLGKEFFYENNQNSNVVKIPCDSFQVKRTGKTNILEEEEFEYYEIDESKLNNYMNSSGKNLFTKAFNSANEHLLKHRELVSDIMNNSFSLYQSSKDHSGCQMSDYVLKDGTDIWNRYSNTMCEDFVKLTELAPTAVGQLAKKVPFAYSNKVCSAINKIGVNQHNDKAWNNAKFYGGLIVGGALTIATLGTASPILAGISIGVGALTALDNVLMYNEEVKNYNELIQVFVSNPTELNNTAFRDMSDEARKKADEYLSGALLELGFSFIDGYELIKSFKKADDIRKFQKIVQDSKKIKSESGRRRYIKTKFADEGFSENKIDDFLKIMDDGEMNSFFAKFSEFGESFTNVLRNNKCSSKFIKNFPQMIKDRSKNGKCIDIGMLIKEGCK